MPVGPGGDNAEGDTTGLSGHRTLQAPLTPVHWGAPGGLPAARGLGDAAVHRQFGEFQADHAVVRLQGQGVELLCYAELSPVPDAASDGAVGAAASSDALATRAVYQRGNHVLEDGPVRDARIVAAERYVSTCSGSSAVRRGRRPVRIEMTDRAEDGADAQSAAAPPTGHHQHRDELLVGHGHRLPGLGTRDRLHCLQLHGDISHLASLP